MLEYISLFILLFTSLVGILEISHIFSEKLFCKKSDDESYITIPLYGENEKLEYVLRCATLKTDHSVILLNCGLNNEQIAKAQQIAKTFDKVKFMDIDEMSRYFKESKA